MKRIIAKSTLREFWEKHADSEQYLKTWYDTTNKLILQQVFLKMVELFSI